MRTLLTIAGFDPSSGAGMTADLAVFSAHGFFGTSAITALTVQTTAGVSEVTAADAGQLARTLAALAEDLPPAGIKLGMLADAAVAAVVVEFLERDDRREVPVVLDPVLRSSSGRALLEPAGVALLRERLLPRVSWVTPNRAELAVLTGLAAASDEEAERAGGVLADGLSVVAAGSGAVAAGLGIVVTGGDGDAADDLLIEPGGRRTWLRGSRIESRSTHGTGCAFSSALLCGLVAGLAPVEAARVAKAYVRRAIEEAVSLGRAGVQGRGPMRLDWPCHAGARTPK